RLAHGNGRRPELAISSMALCNALRDLRAITLRQHSVVSAHYLGLVTDHCGRWPTLAAAGEARFSLAHHGRSIELVTCSRSGEVKHRPTQRYGSSGCGLCPRWNFAIGSE